MLLLKEQQHPAAFSPWAAISARVTLIEQVVPRVRWSSIGYPNQRLVRMDLIVMMNRMLRPHETDLLEVTVRQSVTIEVTLRTLPSAGGPTGQWVCSPPAMGEGRDPVDRE